MTVGVSEDTTLCPTEETYTGFQKAYDFLNRKLFDGELPNCLITLQRRNRTYGYFSGDRFGRTDGVLTDEIALNPSHFHNRPAADVLSTLAHEMVHLWQHHHGTPGRGRYHNREWAARMKEIGLQASSTGQQGGDETGDRVSHYILPDGPFDRAARTLLTRGFSIHWTETPPTAAKAPSEDEDEGEGGETEGTKSGKRVKYTCPRCSLNAWAKHDARLVCGTDMTPMDPASS
jgi:SprT-like family